MKHTQTSAPVWNLTWGCLCVAFAIQVVENVAISATTVGGGAMGPWSRRITKRSQDARRPSFSGDDAVAVVREPPSPTPRIRRRNSTEVRELRRSSMQQLQQLRNTYEAEQRSSQEDKEQAPPAAALPRQNSGSFISFTSTKRPTMNSVAATTDSTSRSVDALKLDVDTLTQNVR